MNRMWKRVMLMVALVFTAWSGQPRAASTLPICDNDHLLKAFRIIDSACSAQLCDPGKLKEIENVDRGDLLRALRDPYLMPVHIFFPSGKSRLDQAFDWSTIKEGQLRTIANLDNPKETVIFIIGHAPTTGSESLNTSLSRDRMYSVYFYLTNVLKVRCKYIKGAYAGKKILRLSDADAMILGLTPHDYRNDRAILNQSVHVFIYPCADKL